MRKQTRRPCCIRWPPPHQRLHPPHSEPTRISRSWCEHQCLPVTCERRFLLVERLGALSFHQILVSSWVVLLNSLLYSPFCVSGVNESQDGALTCTSKKQRRFHMVAK